MSGDNLSDIHRSIIWYVRKNTMAMREEIIREVSWDGPWSRKDVQQALAFLRDQGHVYRVREGWYQTDLKI